MHASRCRAVLFGFAAPLLAGTLLYGGHETPLGGKTLVLVGGRILTQTDQGAVVGTVLIRDGTIAAVGPAIELPADATKIDVKGCIVTPGLIDARSSLWLAGTANRDTANDGGLDVLDGIDAHEENWKEV